MCPKAGRSRGWWHACFGGKDELMHVSEGYLALLDTRSAPHSRARGQPGAAARWVWRHLDVVASIGIFFLSVSFVPIYNKKVFSGGTGIQRFPYPLATAFLQLGFVAVCLALANIAVHLLCRTTCLRTTDEGHSWLLGPHFGYKLRYVAPVGICFGLKYAVTNWGLQLVPTGTHLLLQATDLFWTVTFAHCLNSEHVGPLELMSALFLSVGTVMVSMDATQQLGGAPLPVLVNLGTPIFLGLSVTALRWGVQELMRPDGRLRGTMSLSEFTSVKLAISSFTCLVASLVLEGGVVGLSKHTGLHRTSKPPWWEALAAYPTQGTVLILIGGIFILVFQVNLTWLTRLTSAVTVGVVGGVKVVPQWLLNRALGVGSAHCTSLALVGALLVLASSGLYLWARLQDSLQQASVALVGDGDCEQGNIMESSQSAAVLLPKLEGWRLCRWRCRWRCRMPLNRRAATGHAGAEYLRL